MNPPSCLCNKKSLLFSSDFRMCILSGRLDSNQRPPAPPAPGYEDKSNPGQAQAESRTHLEQLASTLDSSKTWLIFVAGKHYASYVEAKGFDVITGTYDKYSTSDEIARLKVQFVTDISETMDKLNSKA